MKKAQKQTTQWHRTVLLEEAVEGMHAPGGSFFVDGTLGGGGHASALLERDAEAQLMGIDRDPDALARSKARLEPFGARVTLCHGSYAALDEHLAAADFPAQVDGILLDLGVNSGQLDEAERGFSFRLDGPLDMRFDPSDAAVPSAADLVNSLSVEELTKLFRTWGEEPRAKQAARAIVRWREEQGPFSRTGELQQCLAAVLKRPKKKDRGVDPATRCFQALRIAVNEELQQLETFLGRFVDWLRPGGRVAIISFHSLEDRQVKHRFRALAKGCTCPPDFPVCVCGKVPQLKILTKRPIVPSPQEIEENPRARSAKLRIAQRLEDTQQAEPAG